MLGKPYAVPASLTRRASPLWENPASSISSRSRSLGCFGLRAMAACPSTDLDDPGVWHTSARRGLCAGDARPLVHTPACRARAPQKARCPFACSHQPPPTGSDRDNNRSDLGLNGCTVCGDDESDDPSGLVAVHRRLRAWRTEMTGEQTAAMQSLDDALRAGELSNQDAATIEDLIMRGHPHGARKRLTQARRTPDKPQGETP